MFRKHKITSNFRTFCLFIYFSFLSKYFLLFNIFLSFMLLPPSTIFNSKYNGPYINLFNFWILTKKNFSGFLQISYFLFQHCEFRWLFFITEIRYVFAKYLLTVYIRICINIRRKVFAAKTR